VFKKVSEDRSTAQTKITSLEEEAAYLRTKCEFLEQNVHLD
jgi:hypothetical protein